MDYPQLSLITAFLIISFIFPSAAAAARAKPHTMVISTFLNDFSTKALRGWSSEG